MQRPMPAILRHLHHRELGFLGLIGATLILIASYLVAGYGLLDQQGSSWRRIDLKALQQRIDVGDLRDREAGWYHPVKAGQGTPGRTGGVP